jgi:hypothetical protein
MAGRVVMISDENGRVMGAFFTSIDQRWQLQE